MPGIPTPTMIQPRPRSVLAFSLLAFAISWAAWVPAALASRGIISFPLDPTLGRLIGVFGPFLAAVITAAVFEGRAGLGSIFRRFLVWRVGIRWYLFVLFWPAALSLATTGLHVLAGGAAPDFAHPPLLQLYPLPLELKAGIPWALLPFIFLQQALVGSPMGEEPGWRGYALPRLQARWGALGASVGLGLLWGLWHLPLALTRGDPLSQTFFGWTLVGIVADTVLFTWVYNNTRGSLPLAILFHTAIAVTGLLLTPADTHPLVGIALSWAVAALVILWAGPRWLVRGRGEALLPGGA